MRMVVSEKVGRSFIAVNIFTLMQNQNAFGRSFKQILELQFAGSQFVFNGFGIGNIGCYTM